MRAIDDQLKFGLRDAAPATAEAVWGARWIWPDDQLHDRQDCIGDDAARAAVLAWLNETARGKPREEARRLAGSWELGAGMDKQVTLYEDDQGIVVGNPRA